MLDAHILARRIEAERIKEQMVLVEGHCRAVLDRFDHLDCLPSGAEREVRRMEFLKIRMQLGEMAQRVLRLRCSAHL